MLSILLALRGLKGNSYFSSSTYMDQLSTCSNDGISD